MTIRTGARAPLAFIRVRKKPGNDLLSHPAAQAVPSARTGLTSVFGMGTGVAPPSESPGFNAVLKRDSPLRGQSLCFFVLINFMVKPHGLLLSLA